MRLLVLWATIVLWSAQVMAVSLSVQVFDKSTGAYVRGWTVRNNIYDYASVYTRPMPSNTNWAGYNRYIAVDADDGTIWVSDIGTISHWTTDGTPIGSFLVPGTFWGNAGWAGAIGVINNAVYNLEVYNLEVYDVENPGYPSSGCLKRLTKDGTQIGLWVPQNDGEQIKCIDLVIDKNRRIDGLAIWVHYHLTRPTFQPYLAGLLDSIPSGTHQVRYIARGWIGGSWFPLYTYMDCSWDATSFFGVQDDPGIYPDGAYGASIDRITPSGIIPPWIYGAVPAATIVKTSVDENIKFCTDTSLQHFFVISPKFNYYRQYSSNGTLVRNSETYRDAYRFSTWIENIAAVKDIAVDENYVYVLLLTTKPTIAQLSSVVDGYGMHHVAFIKDDTSKYANVSIGDSGDFKNVVTVAEECEKPSIVRRDDGRLSYVAEDGDGDIRQYDSTDNGATWSEVT